MLTTLMCYLSLMARPSNYEPEDTPDSEIAQSDLTAVGKLFPKSDRPSSKSSFEKMPRPPNPSEPRRVYFTPQLMKVLPEIRLNSSSPEEYAENLRRLLNGVFKHKYGSEPDELDKSDIEETIKLQMEVYPLKNSPTPQMRQRRNELEQFQQDFLREFPEGKPYSPDK